MYVCEIVIVMHFKVNSKNFSLNRFVLFKVGKNIWLRQNVSYPFFFYSFRCPTELIKIMNKIKPSI